MSIGDWHSNRWVTSFNEVAEQLLGKSALEVGTALDNDTDLAESILNSINFKSYVFKLRSKVEFYGVSRDRQIYHVFFDFISFLSFPAGLDNEQNDGDGCHACQL